MFKLNLKIAWRSLIRDRSFTILNLLGLSTGLAAAFLIYLWVSDELAVGKFHDHDHLRFQVMHNSIEVDATQTIEPTPGLFAHAIAKAVPEIEYGVPVIPANLFDKEGILFCDNKYVKASRIFAGRDYFHVFPYQLLQGNKDQVLRDKNSVVISRSLATKIFGQTGNLIGRSLAWNQLNYSGIYTISGVFEDFSGEKDESYDIIFSYELFLSKNQAKTANWGNSDASTYLMLRASADPVAAEKKINSVYRLLSQRTKDAFFLQLFSDKYLYNHYENGHPDGGRIQYVKLFSIIGIFILAIASINFINLSTAKASRRVREVGIKKVSGARRWSVMTQYLSESLLITGFALLMAGGILFLLIGPFNQLTGKQLSLQVGITTVFSFLSIGLITALIAGSYPAFYLSGFSPISALKGKLPHSVAELFIRKGLVIFQFTLSIVFIVSMLVIYRQGNYIQHKNLGYDRDHLVWFDKGGLVLDSGNYYKDGGGFNAELESFLQDIKSIPGVVNAANFRHDITNRDGGTSAVNWEGKDPDKKMEFTDLSVGYDFIETLGIQLAAGRSFSREKVAEKSTVVFNEAAIQQMGITNPVGKKVNIWGEDREIIGVVKDFHFQSLHDQIKPCFLDFNFNHWASRIMVRIQAGTEKETIARLQKFYIGRTHGLAFDYHFLDEDFQSLYATETKIETLSTYFAGLAIVISCLGLFGLAAYTAQKRRKELAVRKVVGATAGSIVLLLSKDFLKLVMIAMIIAFPLAWWMMQGWLNHFAYRLPMNVSLYLCAGISVMALALLSIGLQTARAARENPVNSLRSE